MAIAMIGISKKIRRLCFMEFASSFILLKPPSPAAPTGRYTKDTDLSDETIDLIKPRKLSRWDGYKRYQYKNPGKPRGEKKTV